MKYKELDTEKKVVETIICNLEGEDRVKLATFLLQYVDKDKVFEKVDDLKTSRINNLRKEVESLRPTNDRDEMIKAIALNDIKKKYMWDDEVNICDILKIEISKRTKTGYDVWMEYADSDGNCYELDTFVEKGRDFSYNVK